MSNKQELQQLASALERRIGERVSILHTGGRWWAVIGGLSWEDKTKRGLRCYLEGAVAMAGGKL